MWSDRRCRSATQERDAARAVEMGLEKKLIDAFDRTIHQEHPNRHRLNCPGASGLRGLARSEPLQAVAILAHVRECAACLDELKTLRQSMENSRD
jgi:hypothetical protein